MIKTIPSFDTGQPPLAPENGALPDGPGATFALSQWTLGVLTPGGKRDPNLWKTIGYNLDRTVTTKTSGGVIIGDDVCAHINGASFSDIEDGEEGRDNAFGSTIMSMIMGVNPQAEKSTNDLLHLGEHTFIVDVSGMGDSATYQSLTARLYEGRSFVDAQGMPAIPTFDGTDIWPIAPESIVDGSLDKPLAVATNAYVAEEGAGGTFVGQFGESIVLTVDTLSLPDEKGIMRIRIHDPLVTMRFSADRSRVESGTLAGFIDTEEMDAEVRRIIGVFDPTGCNSTVEIAIRDQVRRGSDTLHHGAKDKTRPCEALSVGIEFEATRAIIGPVADFLDTLPSGCSTP